MSDPFVAEVRIMGFNFAPRGWATCDGQLMAISQNTALFSLLGTAYGGDGKASFGLPDLQGAAPVQQGQGPGLSDYFLGQSAGSETVTLFQSELPSHTHGRPVGASNHPATLIGPAGNTSLSIATGGLTPFSAVASGDTTSAVTLAGGSQPHNNMMPSLVLLYCIALQGIFPPRPS